MAEVYASEGFHSQTFCKRTGLLIVHVFIHVPVGRDDGIDEEEIHSCKQRPRLQRNICPTIGGITDHSLLRFDANAISWHGRMVNRQESDLKIEQRKGTEFLPGILLKRKEGEELAAVGENLLGCIHRWWGLNPVEFSVSGIMIIMTMGPDDSINMGRPGPEKLVSHIGGGVYHQVMTP
jgi:hypothetical protein